MFDGTHLPSPRNVVAGAVALAGRASLRRKRAPVRSQLRRMYQTSAYRLEPSLVFKITTEDK